MYDALVMDVYLLARLLKPSLIDSKIAIIYAGYRHIQNYKYFFSKYSLANLIWEQPRTKTDAGDNKCILIPKTIQQKVREITKSYPDSKCLTTRSLNHLAEKFKVSNDLIKTCLTQTSNIHKVPEWKIVELILY